MHIPFIAAGLFALEATAVPYVMEELAKRQTGLPSTAAARAASTARGNCGVTPCLAFNAKEQYVSNKGQYAFKAPGNGDIRGPCPGLNAASNHGYMNRNGISTIRDTVEGLGSMYAMAPDLSGLLAAYAILTDGDPVAGTWSIGGPLPTNPLTTGLIGNGQGISYSHNTYEGDASIARGDAFINKGDAHSLQIPRFAQAFMATASNDRYSLDSFARNYQQNVYESIQNNPYYFSAPVSGLVAPAAYNFVINFMSNHSAAQPSGYLNGAIFKQFFSVVGDSPKNFKWVPGHESIPDNWYRRTSTNQYTFVNVNEDIATQFAAYPDSFRLGGNIGTTKSYVGVDIGDFTGGAFGAKNLFNTNGNGLSCYTAQFMEAAIIDAATPLLQDLSIITNLVNKYIKPVTGGLNCVKVSKYDQTLLNKYPGYKYNPKGSDNPF